MDELVDHMVEINLHDVLPTENSKYFTREVLHTCTRENIRFELLNSRHTTDDNGNGEYNGWFSDDQVDDGVANIRRLSVACDQPFKEWFIVLVHESCHMDQYLTDDITWGNWRSYDDHLDVEEMSPMQLDSWCRRTLSLERNCEQRAILKLRKFGLTDIISIEEYSQKANAYLMFHRFILERKSFYDLGNEPYNNPLIWNNMPDHFDLDYFGKDTEQYMDLYRSHL